MAKAKEKITLITIPPLSKSICKLRLVGDSPLLVHNKLGVTERLHRRYSGPGGKGSAPKEDNLTDDEKYLCAFYVMPGSKYDPPDPRAWYGVPTNGIKKAAVTAIRLTGESDNTVVGVISKSFFLLSDGGGLSRLKFEKLTQDVRGVNVGSGQKTRPELRFRPAFHDWSVNLTIRYNAKLLTPELIANLFMHAGQYVGICELRAEKRQGECGGFDVEML